MKKYIQFGIWVLTACFVVNVQASDSSWYIGAKGGQMSPDQSNISSAINAGILIGYHLPNNNFGSFAVEAEYTTTSSSADYETINVGETIRGDVEFETTALYGVYRSMGDFYFKGKLGVFNNKIYAEEQTIVGLSVTSTTWSRSESGFSWGLGAGWKLGNSSSLELEYTKLDDDTEIDYMSIGFIYNF